MRIKYRLKHVRAVVSSELAYMVITSDATPRMHGLRSLASSSDPLGLNSDQLSLINITSFMPFSLSTYVV